MEEDSRASCVGVIVGVDRQGIVRRDHRHLNWDDIRFMGVRIIHDVPYKRLDSREFLGGL